MENKLHQAFSNSWPDPRGGKSLEEVAVQYLLEFGKASMVQEVLDWVNQQIEIAADLRKKERGEAVTKGEI